MRNGKQICSVEKKKRKRKKNKNKLKEKRLDALITNKGGGGRK